MNWPRRDDPGPKYRIWSRTGASGRARQTCDQSRLRERPTSLGLPPRLFFSRSFPWCRETACPVQQRRRHFRRTEELLARLRRQRGRRAQPAFATGDFANGDGKPDIASIGGSGNVSTPGSASILLNTSLTVAANSAAVTANGDTVTNAGTFSGYRGNSTVTLTATVAGTPFGTIVMNDRHRAAWSWSASALDRPAGPAGPAGPIGPYTVTITATDSGGAHATTSHSRTSIPAPSNVSIRWTDGASTTYNGNSHAATAQWISSQGNGTLPVSYVGINGTTYDPTTTPPTNAGNYQASATLAGDTNDAGSSNTANFTIAPADSHASVAGYLVPYDGKSHSAAGSAVDINGHAASRQ